MEKNNKSKNIKQLTKFLNSNENIFEIGIDEVGRGPLFGRVYTASVILPRDDKFDFSILKDSKKFTSKKKIKIVYDYIIANCIAYSVQYIEHDIIDKINIRNATYECMSKSVKDIIEKLIQKNLIIRDNLSENLYILVDGNYFKPYTYFNNTKQILQQINHETIEHGDSIYCSIAAASIIAKVERDKYIEDICTKFPKLIDYYDLLNNKGYGTLKHMNGIKKYGISEWHRTSFGICKQQHINPSNYYN